LSCPSRSGANARGGEVCPEPAARGGVDQARRKDRPDDWGNASRSGASRGPGGWMGGACGCSRWSFSGVGRRNQESKSGVIVTLSLSAAWLAGDNLHKESTKVGDARNHLRTLEPSW